MLTPAFASRLLPCYQRPWLEHEVVSDMQPQGHPDRKDEYEN